jgi:hypothetical protein
VERRTEIYLIVAPSLRNENDLVPRAEIGGFSPHSADRSLLIISKEPALQKKPAVLFGALNLGSLRHPVLASVPSASVRIGGEKHFATFCATPERLVFTLNVFAADDEKRHGGGEAPVWAAPDDGANTVSLGDGMRHRGHAHRVRRHEENGTGLSRREVLFLSLPDPPVRERGSLAGRLQRRRGGGHGRRGG